jgi:predicted O-methyltransferase YrrM
MPAISSEISCDNASTTFGALRVVSSRALGAYFDNNARLGANADIDAFAAWIKGQDASPQAPEPSAGWGVTQPYLVYHAWRPGFFELPSELRATVETLRRGRAGCENGRALESALEAAGFRSEQEPELPLLVAKTDVFFSMQNRVELERLLRLVLARRPRCVVEIGSARGGSLYCLTQVAARDALIVSIDLPGGPCGGGQTELECEVFRSFAGAEQRLTCVRGPSCEARTRQALQGVLDGRPIDVLFIDGDHRYDSVKADFFGYCELVRPGGLIVLHDVLALAEVHAFWRELEARYTTEIIRDPAGFAPVLAGIQGRAPGRPGERTPLAYGLGLVHL